MRRLVSILLLFVAWQSQAQDVWKEGTQWIVIHDSINMSTYELSGHTIIDGVDYLNLIFDNYENAPLAHIRTERGDTVVYIRFHLDEEVSDEFVLYDFGTFESGTPITYLVDKGDYENVVECTELINGDSICYFYDVIEDGDILPCYKGIIFKVGHIGGPVALIMDYINSYQDGDNPGPPKPKPKPKNISHLVLKLNGRNVEISNFLSAVIQPKLPCNSWYNLNGIQISSMNKGIVISGGNKYIINKK